ncbi:MAG TPA: hypothetical protein VN112_02285 [Ensifer sp.]|nr:hypothetical protein [Ensifer sp.]
MIRIDTIGALIEYRYDLSVHCHARDCWNRGTVDLEALAVRLGKGHSFLAKDLRRFFRCSKCGSKDVGFILSPFTNCVAGLASTPVHTPSPTMSDESSAGADGVRRRRRSRR